jgi:hypothetical protein
MAKIWILGKEDTHWRDVFRKENLLALGAATFIPM